MTDVVLDVLVVGSLRPAGEVLPNAFLKVLVFVGDFPFRTCVDVSLDEICDCEDYDLGENLDCVVRNDWYIVLLNDWKLLDDPISDLLDGLIDDGCLIELVCYLYRLVVVNDALLSL